MSDNVKFPMIPLLLKCHNGITAKVPIEDDVAIVVELYCVLLHVIYFISVFVCAYFCTIIHMKACL